MHLPQSVCPQGRYLGSASPLGTPAPRGNRKGLSQPRHLLSPGVDGIAAGAPRTWLWALDKAVLVLEMEDMRTGAGRGQDQDSGADDVDVDVVLENSAARWFLSKCARKLSKCAKKCASLKCQKFYCIFGRFRGSLLFGFFEIIFKILFLSYFTT